MWVKKYKNLENFGLNLCSSLQYDYNPKNYTLHSENKDNLPNDLFNKKFSEISAIVGKNASGKSNSLELICQMLKGNLKNTNDEYIIIFENNGIRDVFSSKKLHKELKIKSDIKHTIHSDLSSIPTTNVIYFSNVYDGRKLHIKDRGMKIISANNNYSHRFSAFSQKQDSSIFRKQISFIKNIGKKKLKDISLDIPSNIIVELNFRNQADHLDKNKKISQYNKTRFTHSQGSLHSTETSLELLYETLNYKLTEAYCNCIYSYEDTVKSYIGALTCTFASKIIEHLINVDITQLMASNSVEQKLTSIIENIENNDLDSINDDLLELLTSERLINTNTLFEYTEVVNCLSETYDELSEADVDNISDRSSASSGRFKIKFKSSTNLSSNTYELIEKLIIHRIIHVEWEGISSGHNAFLKLFSLISDALKSTRASTIICIDEGDLYLHPKWQIEFFRNIEQILPLFSTSESQKLQLVLTSHSPFLLTDLPRNNIIIINDGKVVIDDKLQPLKTFGANLYELYGKAFFLDGGKIGTFAFDKIMKVTDEVFEQNISNKRKCELVDFVSIFGDVIVRNQLMMELDNKDD